MTMRRSATLPHARLLYIRFGESNELSTSAKTSFSSLMRIRASRSVGFYWYESDPRQLEYVGLLEDTSSPRLVQMLNLNLNEFSSFVRRENPSGRTFEIPAVLSRSEAQREILASNRGRMALHSVLSREIFVKHASSRRAKREFHLWRILGPFMKSIRTPYCTVSLAFDSMETSSEF